MFEPLQQSLRITLDQYIQVAICTTLRSCSVRVILPCLLQPAILFSQGGKKIVHDLCCIYNNKSVKRSEISIHEKFTLETPALKRSKVPNKERNKERNRQYKQTGRQTRKTYKEKPMRKTHKQKQTKNTHKLNPAN